MHVCVFACVCVHVCMRACVCADVCMLTQTSGTTCEWRVLWHTYLHPVSTHKHTPHSTEADEPVHPPLHLLRPSSVLPADGSEVSEGGPAARSSQVQGECEGEGESEGCKGWRVSVGVRSEDCRKVRSGQCTHQPLTAVCGGMR